MGSIILTIEDKAPVTDLPMGDEEDDGNISDATTIPFEYDQDVKDAISIGTSITCPENKTVIIDEYGINNLNHRRQGPSDGSAHGR